MKFAWAKCDCNCKAKYSNVSSIHGVRYVSFLSGKKRLSVIAKILWGIVFLVAIFMCVMAIERMRAKWIDNPLLLSLEEKPIPISKIPFPAVTICPSIKINKQKFDFYDIKDMISESQMLTYEQKNNFLAAQEICQRNLSIQEKELISNWTPLNYTTFLRSLKNISNPEESIHLCSWSDGLRHHENCKNNFQKILTPEGVCYTFNMQNYRRIFQDDV